ncbi:Fur family transcriptional regulator [Thioalkalivibrio sp. ALE11]|uniref:Fur family transcriptional regulator n=1 Tax=Thioalkalivibrio sp. ALE11 TaxID=1265494 RepID=UPI0003685648|nr:transcriptional repressor [Thioalkalivibrio sp. ALE11]
MSTRTPQPDLLGIDDARALLRDYRISPTEQRIEIVRVLFARNQHLSADHILAQLTRQESRVSKATVYNALKLFAEKGLVREVIVDPSRVFYDSNRAPHHHLFHVDSGQLEDVEPAQVQVNDLPPLPEGTDVLSVDVIVRVGPGQKSGDS